MLELPEKMPPKPRPCRIHAVNGGQPLPMMPLHDGAHHHHSSDRDTSSIPNGQSKSCPKGMYYDFAIVGECGDVDACLNDFCHLMGLHEVESFPSYMSKDELYSLMKRR